MVSTADGSKSFYTLWTKQKDQGVLAELPQNFAAQKHYLALTVSSGESYAGLHAGELYFYWKQYGKRMALMIPNTEIRSTGDQESQSSVKRLFTDEVLLDVPILGWVQRGGPIIDVDELCVGMAEKFFTRHATGIQKNLYKIKLAKAFPNNVELAFEVPVQGKIKSFHYSFSMIPEGGTYQPRVADERIGFFTTSYTDFGKMEPERTKTRFVNRWHLEKADASLKLSPPKNPIIFYVEHTTPIRYRRWIKEGVLMWNKAFERVGLVNALEVRFQDAATGENMEKDPEDVRYNFIRWLNNGVGTAIGPSRVNPMTGQILDADIIMTDGWIRHWWTNFNDILPSMAMEGMTPETLQWLHQNPNWDPRVRLASPEKRAEMLDSRARQPMPALGGHPMAAAKADPKGQFLGEAEYGGLAGRASQQNGYCSFANAKTEGLAAMAMQLEMMAPEEIAAAAPAGGVGNDQVLDGVPEWFIGPLLADVTVHEVGHTLGLRHNFKASSQFTFEEINSDAVKGKKPLTASVMDYVPINMVAGKKLPQGDYGMISVGPYDEWAIEYGYTFEKDLKPILARVAEPALAYATDEDTIGPDPLARRYDFGKNPLSYAQNQMEFARGHREKLLDKFVKDGESWAKARRGYQLSLRQQMGAVNMMAAWVGGTFIHRDKKGDPNGRPPTSVVPVEDQRAALKFVVENSFNDEAFGLTPKLMQHMSVDQWWDMEMEFESAAWPVHDRIGGIQASVLTAIMNPTTLARVYDNELRTPGDQDALTMPELLDSIKDSIWDELDKVDAAKAYTPRQPLISSLQRNLQREHLDRLMDLANSKMPGAVGKASADLAMQQLATIKAKMDGPSKAGNVDAYSRSHLAESINRIQKLQDTRYVLVK